MDIMKKRLANLLSVKSIVTLMCAAGTLYGFVVGKISGEQFMLIESSIIAFYFGTQSQKTQELLDKAQENKQ